MIGSIKGIITFKSDKFILVEAHGVGYKVNVSVDTLTKAHKLGDEIFLHTHLHVREDILDLYGFIDRAELEFFELLISVSGIGPKGALIILGIAPIETLKKAIKTGDLSYLTKISGIGKKTAEKIILELRDKLGKEEHDESLGAELDALEALKSLGYSNSEARDALKQSKSTDTNTKVKEALKILSKR